MCGATVKFGALASVDRICDRNLMQAHFLGDDLEVISVGEIVSTQTVVSGWSMYSEISLTGKAVVAFCRALSVWSHGPLGREGRSGGLMLWGAAWPAILPLRSAMRPW